MSISEQLDRLARQGMAMPDREQAGHCNASQPTRLCNRLVIIAGLMNIISPACRWPQRLLALRDEYPRIPTARMGFPDH